MYAAKQKVVAYNEGMNNSLLLLILLVKSDKELFHTVKPVLDSILENKELLTLLLQEEKPQERTEEKKTPPPFENETENFALEHFLERYIK